MYATAEDMRARYGEAVLVQLTNADAWGAVSIAAIGVKLADATALIDGYVAKYYARAETVTVPPLLVRIACEITYADLSPTPTDEAKSRRSAAERQLRDIANGLLKLDDGTTEALPTRDGQVIVPEAERTFSRGSLSGF